jgi:hypothetical protein
LVERRVHMSSIATALKQVRFVVDAEGNPTAAIVDMDAWRMLLGLIEDSEDVRLARERLAGWKKKEGFAPWPDDDEGEASR